MTDRAQFEAMLNALINEDQDAAKEIFHNIVVAKSREIYEELLESDFEQQEMEEAFPAAEEEEEEEGPAEDDEEAMDDEEGDEESEEDPFGDEEGDEEGEGSMDDAEQSDRILDLEDALEELKAEFEQLMAGEEGEDMGGMDDMDGMDDMGGMDAEPKMDMGIGEEDELAGLMEYVNQVGGKTYNTFGKMGDKGANTKPILASKNDMGGTAGNIAQNFSTTKGGTEGGLAKPSAGDLTSGLGTVLKESQAMVQKKQVQKKQPTTSKAC